MDSRSCLYEHARRAGRDPVVQVQLARSASDGLRPAINFLCFACAVQQGLYTFRAISLQRSRIFRRGKLPADRVRRPDIAEPKSQKNPT